MRSDISDFEPMRQSPPGTRNEISTMSDMPTKKHWQNSRSLIDPGHYNAPFHFRLSLCLLHEARKKLFMWLQVHAAPGVAIPENLDQSIKYLGLAFELLEQHDATISFNWANHCIFSDEIHAGRWICPDCTHKFKTIVAPTNLASDQKHQYIALQLMNEASKILSKMGGSNIDQAITFLKNSSDGLKKV